MSDAIVAKAINDSIGTKNFKGLNTILDEHLNSLDAVLKENIEGIKEAIMPVSNLSNPIYMFKEGDAPLAYISVENGTSKKIQLEYEGIVAIDYRNATLKYTNVTPAGKFVDLNDRETYCYRVSSGAQIWITATSGLGELTVYGHTEFAPPLKVEII